MNIHTLHGAPAPELAEAMERFEEHFRSPFGPNLTLRMSYHGNFAFHYTSLGEGACFVAERDGRVLGLLGAALVTLLLPDGSEQKVNYVGDVRLLPEARKGTLMYRLGKKATDWAVVRTQVHYSYVKESTPIKPSEYSGRLGIPYFEPLGKAVLLRIPTRPARNEQPGDRLLTTHELGTAGFRQLSRGRCARLVVNRGDRSVMEPQWLMTPNGFACGRLEDRLKVSRVLMSDGTERLPAYLTSFAFCTAAAGAELLEVALRRSARLGYHALYVTIAERDLSELQQFLRARQTTFVPATLYGHALPRGVAWNLNSSEL